jgi:60 kDa SS-A/Ro ribonucleoprotein
MGKFNEKSTYSTRVQNKEGAKAYKLDAETELYTLVVTSLVTDKFYAKEADELTRLRALIKACDPVFVAKLAIYARNSMYLRSIPIVLTVELNKVLKEQGQKATMIEHLSNSVIKRADEITEMLAYYASVNSDNAKANPDGTKKKLCKLSKALQRGLASAFNKFDEYQFAKYNRKGEVTLKDALFLTHPKPKDGEQEALFKAITNDTLSTPYTWEVELSTAEEKGKTKTQVWEELIMSKKLGYMALLRNLRNMLEAKVSKEHIIEVAKLLSNKEAVEKSKQLPFRFFSAYRELTPANRNRYNYDSSSRIELDAAKTRIILDALEQAVKHATSNIKHLGFDESVAMVCDVSGSMMSSISPRSKVEMYHVGLLLAMCAQHKCSYVETGLFGDTYKAYPMPKDNILMNTVDLESKEGEVGYSTNGYKVIQNYIANNKKFDKIMIFTDCQMWDSYYSSNDIQSEWSKYKKMYPSAKLYLFDLQGYGNSPVNTHDNDVYTIAGWSDKIFDVLNALEGKASAIDVIKQTVTIEKQ